MRICRTRPCGRQWVGPLRYTPRKCTPTVKGPTGVRVPGEGSLVDGPQHNDALRYALARDVLHCFSIDCESLNEVLDHIARIETLAVSA